MITPRPVRAVYKYPFKVEDKFSISLPREPEIVHVDIHFGQPYMWVLVDPTDIFAPRHFQIFGTGVKIPPDEHLQHVRTFFLNHAQPKHGRSAVEGRA